MTEYIVELSDETFAKLKAVGMKLDNNDFNAVVSFCANAGITALNTIEAEIANKKFIEQCTDWFLYPSNFNGSNLVLLPPEGKTSEEVAALCAAHIRVDTTIAVMTCWKPTKDHLEEIAKTGCIWIVAMGVTSPPMIVAAKKPTDYPGIDFIVKG